jgi:hypothetical protein
VGVVPAAGAGAGEQIGRSVAVGGRDGDGHGRSRMRF